MPDATIPDDPETGLVLLPGNCATVVAEDLRARLVLAAGYAPETRVNASAVENLGQAVLQVLLAARAEADARGHAFAIEAPSEAFVRRVATLGLAEALHLTPTGLPDTGTDQ